MIQKMNVSPAQNCPVCGKPSELIENIEGRNIWQCNNCGNRYETEVTRANIAEPEAQPTRETGAEAGKPVETLPKSAKLGIQKENWEFRCWSCGAVYSKPSSQVLSAAKWHCPKCGKETSGTGSEVDERGIAMTLPPSEKEEEKSAKLKKQKGKLWMVEWWDGSDHSEAFENEQDARDFAGRIRNSVKVSKA